MSIISTKKLITRPIFNNYTENVEKVIHNSLERITGTQSAKKAIITAILCKNILISKVINILLTLNIEFPQIIIHYPQKVDNLFKQ